MPSEPLSAIESSAGVAIRSGSWSEAQALLSGYCVQAEAALRALPAGAAADAFRLAARVTDFLTWANRMALAGRSDLAEQIRQLPSLSGYAAHPAPDGVRSWQIEG